MLPCSLANRYAEGYAERCCKIQAKRHADRQTDRPTTSQTKHKKVYTQKRWQQIEKWEHYISGLVQGFDQETQGMFKGYSRTKMKISKEL